MAEKNQNKQIQKNKQPTEDMQFLPTEPENTHLINQTIMQILVERDSPEEIKDLMRAELDYNKERLQIIRDHALLHPDAIENRKTKKFRRTQYGFLMGFLLLLLGVIFIAPTAISIALSSLAMMVTAGIVINGRDRDNDSETLLTLLNNLIKAAK